MRKLFIIGLLMFSGGVLANSFEFAGLSLATTPLDIAKRYPNSEPSSGYVRLSPKDTHNHIYAIELFGPRLSYRLRINFGSPDNKYPPCEPIERVITLRHGTPTEIEEFYEEAMKSRHLVWKLESETVRLQCFGSNQNANYSAEAIAVQPTESSKSLTLPSGAAKARSSLAPYMDAHFFAKRSIHNFEHR